MSGEKINQEFRLKIIEEFIEEINQNELMTKKHKKVCKILNYIEHLLILVSTITGCVSIFCFCFFNWYLYKNYEFCNRIKNL